MSLDQLCKDWLQLVITGRTDPQDLLEPATGNIQKGKDRNRQSSLFWLKSGSVSVFFRSYGLDLETQVPAHHYWSE
jgi:hypothetical protein